MSGEGGEVQLPGQLHFNINNKAALTQIAQNDYACGSWYTEALAGSGKINPAKPVLLELLSLIVSDADTSALEKTLAKAPQLMLNLLKLVNSVGMGGASQARSIRQAITLLGRRQLQRWLQLLLYAEQYGDDAITPPILIAAALRGKRLALWSDNGWLPGVDSDEAFLCGMLSLLDRLFGEPLVQLIDPLPLAPSLRSALLDGEGVLGHALLQLCALEAAQADTSTMSPMASDPTRWIHSEIKAIAWVRRLVSESF